MNTTKLYRVLVIAGAASTAGMVGCGGKDEGDGETNDPVNQGGSENAGGAASETGGASPGGRPSTGGASGSDCSAQCETLSNGWVMCNGACCWLGASDPCC